MRPNESNFFEILSEKVEKSDVFSREERKANNDQVISTFKRLQTIDERILEKFRLINILQVQWRLEIQTPQTTHHPKSEYFYV